MQPFVILIKKPAVLRLHSSLSTPAAWTLNKLNSLDSPFYPRDRFSQISNRKVPSECTAESQGRSTASQSKSLLNRIQKTTPTPSFLQPDPATFP